VESEPPYVYVRGNPVNFADPSGLLRNDVIVRELGLNNFNQVKVAFRKSQNWGLLKALQDANVGDVIYLHRGNRPPAKEPFPDYSQSAGIEDTAYGSKWEVLAAIRCDNGKVAISWYGFKDYWKNGYLSEPYNNPLAKPGLDAAYSINKLGVKSNSSMPAYLNAGRPPAPDFVGVEGQISVWKVFGGNGALIMDRYGRRYIVPGLSTGIGTPFGFQSFQGYYGSWVSLLSPDNIPNPDDLENYLVEWGLSSNASLIRGLTGGANLAGGSGATTYGVNGGISLTLSYSVALDKGKNAEREKFGWDWVDRVKGFDESDIKTADEGLNACDKGCSPY
jgi:hypothetical protein